MLLLLYLFFIYPKRFMFQFNENLDLMKIEIYTCRTKKGSRNNRANFTRTQAQSIHSTHTYIHTSIAQQLSN